MCGQVVKRQGFKWYKYKFPSAIYKILRYKIVFCEIFFIGSLVDREFSMTTHWLLSQVLNETTYACVMLHTCMSHVTCMNESCHTFTLSQVLNESMLAAGKEKERMVSHMTHSYVTWRIYMLHDAFICDMTSRDHRIVAAGNSRDQKRK